VEDCERIASALRASITVVEMPEGATQPLRGSVGFAVFPDEATAVDSLAELADMRMYRDKRRQIAEWEDIGPEPNLKTMKPF
jgi:GGDEF domain-containing protein